MLLINYCHRQRRLFHGVCVTLNRFQKNKKNKKKRKKQKIKENLLAIQQ